VTTRRRLTPEQRRTELLDVAAGIVGESGTEALSLEQVAARAGCSRNLVYNYFPNRSELVDGLRGRERDAVIAEITGLPHGAPFAEWIEHVCRAVLSIAAQRGHLLVLLVEPEELVAGRERRLFLLDIVAAKLRSAGVGPGRSVILANLLGGALMGGAAAVVNRGSSPDTVAAEFLAMALPLVGEPAGRSG